MRRQFRRGRGAQQAPQHSPEEEEGGWKERRPWRPRGSEGQLERERSKGIATRLDVPGVKCNTGWCTYEATIYEFLVTHDK